MQPENILIGDDGCAKLGDLGLSICLDVSCTDGYDAAPVLLTADCSCHLPHPQHERPVTRVGTLEFMGPEVLRCLLKSDPFDNKDREDLAYGPAADIWALGCVVFECIHGHPLFPGGTVEEMLEALKGEADSGRITLDMRSKPGWAASP